MPVRTCPVPIFARRGGAPRPNGPEPSSSVGLQPVAVGAEAPEPGGTEAEDDETGGEREQLHGLRSTRATPSGLGDGGLARAGLLDAGRRRADDRQAVRAQVEPVVGERSDGGADSWADD